MHIQLIYLKAIPFLILFTMIVSVIVINHVCVCVCVRASVPTHMFVGMCISGLSFPLVYLVLYQYHTLFITLGL